MSKSLESVMEASVGNEAEYELASSAVNGWNLYVQEEKKDFLRRFERHVKGDWKALQIFIGRLGVDFDTDSMNCEEVRPVKEEGSFVLSALAHCGDDESVMVVYFYGENLNAPHPEPIISPVAPV